MIMVKNGIGGANTKTGLAFEGEDAFELFYMGDHVANIFKKHAIYIYLQKHHNLN